MQLLVTSGTVAHQALYPWDFPGKNTGVGCHFPFQRIFPTQGSNTLLHWWAGSLLLSHKGRLPEARPSSEVSSKALVENPWAELDAVSTQKEQARTLAPSTPESMSPASVSLLGKEASCLTSGPWKDSWSPRTDILLN